MRSDVFNLINDDLLLEESKLKDNYPSGVKDAGSATAFSTTASPVLKYKLRMLKVGFNS